MTTDREVDLDRARALLMAALDGELSTSERRELEGLVAGRPDLQAEWTRLARVKEVTVGMSLQQLPEEVWDRYWGSVYARVERGVAWVLVSAGAIVLAGYWLWHAVGEFLAGTDGPLTVRIAVVALALGGTILVISVLRERWYMGRRDRYSKEIVR